ncbi:MAG: MarR family transcriptional regulator [Frankiaceae bacterium]|nr:MarR family transcriptional regulator [Frankiaceae bacterium]MBV9369842.1 MarR family transcriptional regulator [Frankiales bacterium]
MATRWLSKEQQRAWRAYIEAVRLLQDSLDAQLQADAGMPHAYYEILVRLSETPGRRLRMAELATGTQSSRSRVSHAVTRLEERGWVRREACESDRRGQNAVLTDEGFAALAAAAPGHVGQVRATVIDALSPAQLRALADASTTIADAVRALDEPTGPG